MKELSLKNFFPSFHVKCGGATYTRINTISLHNSSFLMCLFFLSRKMQLTNLFMGQNSIYQSHFLRKSLVPPPNHSKLLGP